MKQTALITGTSRGIGKACAELFVENGIVVLAPSRAEMDLNSSESIRNYIKSLDAKIDILVNNAGINAIANIIELDFEKSHKVMQTNFWAPTLLINLLAPQMKAQGYGRIVNTSSIWSTVTREGRSTYASSKAALNALTRTIAVELAEYNVLVNAVAPGYVQTELTYSNNTPEQIEQITQNIPIKRMAEPKEIAELIYFLCSSKNTFITGQTIIADGGYTIL